MVQATEARNITICDMVRRARNLNQQAVAYRANGNYDGYRKCKGRSLQFMSVAHVLSTIRQPSTFSAADCGF